MVYGTNSPAPTISVYDPSVPTSALNPSVTNVPQPGVGYTALAIMPNINGGTLSPTFYSKYSANSIRYWNGNTWINTGHTMPTISDMAGCSTTLYGLISGAPTTSIYAYNGTSNATLILTLPTIFVSDIEVDCNCNFYLMNQSQLSLYNSLGASLCTWSVTNLPGSIGNKFGLAITSNSVYISDAVLGVYVGLISGAAINFTLLTSTFFGSDYATCGGACAASSITAVASSNGTITCVNPTVNVACTVTTALSPLSYFWSGSGLVGAVNNSVAMVSMAGTYSCLVSTVGCPPVQLPTQTMVTTVVSTNTVPTVASINPSGNLCLYNTFTLNASPNANNYTSTWTGAGLINGANSPTLTLNAAGVYSLSVTNIVNGCVGTATATVNAAPQLTLSPSSNTLCAQGFNGSSNTITLTANGASNYTLFVGANFSTAVPNASTMPIQLLPPYYAFTSLGTATLVGFDGACSNTTTSSFSIFPNPTISINPATATQCFGNTQTFNASGATSYSWFPATGLNNTVGSGVIATAGASLVYSVIAANAYGCNAAAQSASFNVLPLPTLTISPNSPSICANTTSVALNAIGTATLFNWQPNQNLSATNTQSVLAYPNSTQVYTLTGSLNGCILQKTVAVNVVPPPNPLITLSSPSACAQALNSSPNTITLTLSGANTYTLNAPNYFNNPNPSGPNSPISLLPPYQATGLSTATLYGSNGVCTISSTAVFTIIANPTVSINSYTPIICAGQSFTYINSGASFYTWSSSTPGQTLNATGNIAVVSPSISSVFSVFGSSLGCYSALQTSSITVNPLPIVSISPNPTFVCLGSEVALIAAGTGTFYTWQPPNYLNTTTGAQVNANPPQQINYTVISALNNCTNSAVVTISVMPLPTPSITANTTTLCLNQKLILQGFGGTSYSWLLPNNSILTSQTMTLMVNNSMYSGTYTLMVSDANACVNSATTTIKVENLPSGYLNYNNSLNNCVPFCNNYTFVPSGATTTLSSNINQFNWQINNQSVSTQNRFSYCFINAGVYVVKGDLTSDLGCTNSVTMQIIAYPKPIADFTYSPEHPLENMEEVSFLNTGKDQNIKTFNWLFMFDKTEYSSNQINPSFLFENAGTYSVALIVTNDYQCKDTLIKTITVASDFAVYVPNTFSPNQDNKNEIFNAVTRGVNKYSIQIFNRWGQKVFESNDLNNGWDGTFKGQVCKSGVYGWKISASSYDGMLKELTGQVMVYR